MITRLPSYQREYTDHWSGDPALLQPPPEPADDASSESRDRYVEALEEYWRKLRVARETGNWQPMRVGDAAPTSFIMGQVDRNIWRAIRDRMTLPADNALRIGAATGTALLFRLALTKIVGLDIDVDRRPDARWEGWVMASPEVVNELDAIHAGIVTELGDEVFIRLRGISKKP